MLLLARSYGQRVRLTLPDGAFIWITIAEVRPYSGLVRLGIDAPRSVVIEREEIIPKEVSPCQP